METEEAVFLAYPPRSDPLISSANAQKGGVVERIAYSIMWRWILIMMIE